MSDIPKAFGDLVDAIEQHGCDMIITPQVRSVIDRYNMLVIDRSDGTSIEVDFGLRHGDQSILAHFLVYPADDGTVHIAYDIDWHGAPGSADQPAVERRSWNWEVTPVQPVSDDEPSLFGILQ